MLGALSPGRTIWGIPWYSLLIVSAIVLAVFLCSKEEKRLSLPKDTIIDLALWLIPCGIIGARLYYVAFEWERFAPDPISILYIWEGGIAIYGALLGGLLAACFFARRRKLSLSLLADIIMPTVALAQAIGRWGNYFNMEAYGELITNPSWQFFPFGVLIPGIQGKEWHLATFFYESVWDFGVFLILWKFRKHALRAGDVALWYILLYGPGRGFIEGLRLDSLYAGGGLRISQWLSLIACMIVCTVFMIRSIKRRSISLPAYAISLLGLAGLYGSFAWEGWLCYFPALLILVSLCILIITQKPKVRLIWPFLLAVCQLLALMNQSHMDAVLFKTIQTAVAGLMITAASYVLYPHTKAN